MKAMLSRRPSAAMVVALIALFAAMGGVGYAAATIDSGDIVNNSIRSKDVHNRDLRAGDIKQTNSVTGPKLGSIVVRTETVSVPSGDTAGAEATCQAGEQLISGGGRWDGGMAPADAAALHTVHSYPVTNSWFARGYNGTAGPRDYTAQAFCLDN
jgi:hypothetical protein